ncbi:MAG: Ig domain-containing protein, partial [Acidobacteriia bacterium]|nr:Ig domain-containing protein [Terriglobia bacterium]
MIVVLCMPLRAQAQLTITSGDTYTLSIGHVELQLSASGGTGAYTWSIIGGTPPPGLMLRSDVPPWFSPGVGEGLIGVATTPGTYNFTIQVADGAASTAQQAVSVTITSFIITSSQNLPDGFEGTPYAHQETVTGFPNGATLTWTPNAPMPPGLSLGSDGLLSGTPTQSGFFNVEYRVSDGFDLVNANHNLGIFPVQITTDALLPFATINQSYNQTLAASGGSGNYTFTFGGGSLPNGVSFNAGTISGTPTQAGRYAFSVTVADANDNGKSYTKQMSLVVANVPPTLPQIVPYGNRVDDCTVGVQCERAFGNFSLGPAPITWTASGLPIGMSIRWGSLANQWVSPGDGEIWGTPAAAGNYSVTLTTTDATGASATNTFPLHVSALIQTNNLPGGAMGAAYSTAFRVVGGSGSYTAALTGGSLPLGLTFDGVLLTISGTPIEGGSFNPQFTFDDGQGNVKTDTYFLYISNAGSTAQPLSINNSDLGNAMLNAPWSYQLNACCRASVVWSLESGSLPAGVSLSSGGLLSGTPTVAGQHTFVVRATDGADFTTRQLTLNVTPVFISMNTSLPFGNVSVPYSQQLQASGGTGPYTWTLAPGSFLPPGLTLTSDGLLAGTPPASGQFNFNVNVEDTVTLNRTVGYFSLAIYPTDALPPLRITTNGNFGTWSIGAIQTELDAFDGAGGYTWSLFSGDLPPGLAVRPDGPPWFSHSASGGIIGVATTPGTYNFTLRVTDHDGAFVDLAGTMRIVPLTIKDLWNLPDAFTNTAYSYTLTPLGNGGAVTWGAPNCGNPSCLLPPGLTLNSATGEISGTPTTPGFYNSQISVSADGATIVWSLNIGVHAINVGASTPLVGGATYELPNATQGQPYSVTFTASGGSAPLTFSSNSLPNGLSLDPLSGVMSGTYNGGSGRFWFSITATDSTATSYTRSFAVRGVTSPAVLPGIGINGGRFDDCTLGMGCTRGMWVASGAAAPFTWSASGLPAGMSLRPGGVAYWNDGTPAGDAEIWGVPTELGDFNVTITVTDATGAQVSGVFPLHVSELWLDTRLPNGTYNTGYGPGGLGANLRVLGGSASYSTALTSTPNNRLPAGLLFDGANNVVAGTPFETGSFNPDLLISDTANPAHQLRLFNFFFISDQGIGTIQINTGSDLGYWSPGSNANITFSACCVPSYVWSVDGGSLPAGTSLNWNTGQLTGTLTTAGTFAFLLRASNANDTSNFAVRQFTLVVSPLIQTTFTLPFGNLNVPYSQTLSAGCVNGFTCNGTSFSLAPYSVLPPGLALGSGGLLSGTPTATGLFSFTVLATDLGGHTLRMNFSLSIYPVGELPPVNLSIGPNLGPFQIGQVTINLSTSNTSGGVPPYHYALSPGANVIPGMRVQDGPPLPTNFTSASFSPVP